MIDIKYDKTSLGYIVTKIYSNENIVEIPSTHKGELVYGIDGSSVPAGITKIYIPETVKHISFEAFINAKDLNYISVDNKNTEYSSFDGILYSKNKDILISCPQAYPKNFFIGLDMTISIMDKAFYKVNHLEKVIFDNVTFLGLEAFAESSLKEIKITSIDGDLSRDVFLNCAKLESIMIGKRWVYLTSKKSGLCDGCNKLATITLITEDEDEVYTVPDTDLLEELLETAGWD